MLFKGASPSSRTEDLFGSGTHYLPEPERKRPRQLHSVQIVTGWLSAKTNFHLHGPISQMVHQDFVRL